MIKRIIALNRTIVLPVPIAESDVAENQKVLSIIRESDPEMASQLESVAFQTRIEEQAVVIYREGATMG